MKNYNNQLTNRNSRVYYDPFFEDFFDFAMPKQEKLLKNLMKTDISENETSYEFTVELPGYKKENVSLDLDNGYLTISAVKEENTETDKKFIRRERFHESCKRSFYLGDNVSVEDVSANMDNGVLSVVVNKKVDEDKGVKRIEIK